MNITRVPYSGKNSIFTTNTLKCDYVHQPRSFRHSANPEISLAEGYSCACEPMGKEHVGSRGGGKVYSFGGWGVCPTSRFCFVRSVDDVQGPGIDSHRIVWVSTVV